MPSKIKANRLYCTYIMGCLIINISFKWTLYTAFPHFFLHAMKTERARLVRTCTISSSFFCSRPFLVRTGIEELSTEYFTVF